MHETNYTRIKLSTANKDWASDLIISVRDFDVKRSSLWGNQQIDFFSMQLSFSGRMIIVSDKHVP